MTTIADRGPAVTVGIDTHADINVAVVLDPLGQLLGTRSFETTKSGHQSLEGWVLGFGPIDAAGIEGTGSWGAGIARYLSANGHRVVEVDQPDRKTRYRRGKSDTIDAESAARAVQAGTANGTPKTRTGSVEAIRSLRVARRSALKARSSAIHQLHSLISTAPDDLRAGLNALPATRLIAACAALRPTSDLADPTQAAKFSLRSIARRYKHLTAEINELDTQLETLITQTAPALLQHQGVGIDVAGQLLVTAGDNPDRVHSPAAFAHLCGAAPIPIATGKSDNHRLNRGGDRAANAALYRIVLCRLRWDPRTRDYVERRTKEGKSKKAIIRCLKNYVAREIYPDLCRSALDNP